MDRYPSNNIRRISCSLMLILAMLTATNIANANTEAVSQIKPNKKVYALTEEERAKICMLLMIYPEDTNFRRTFLGEVDDLPECEGDTRDVVRPTPPSAPNRRMSEADEDVRLSRID